MTAFRARRGLRRSCTLWLRAAERIAVRLAAWQNELRQLHTNVWLSKALRKLVQTCSVYSAAYVVKLMHACFWFLAKVDQGLAA